MGIMQIFCYILLRASLALDSAIALPVSIGHIAMQTDEPQGDYTYDHTNQVYYTVN